MKWRRVKTLKWVWLGESLKRNIMLQAAIFGFIIKFREYLLSGFESVPKYIFCIFSKIDISKKFISCQISGLHQKNSSDYCLNCYVGLQKLKGKKIFFFLNSLKNYFRQIFFFNFFSKFLTQIFAWIIYVLYESISKSWKYLATLANSLRRSHNQGNNNNFQHYITHRERHDRATLPPTVRTQTTNCQIEICELLKTIEVWMANIFTTANIYLFTSRRVNSNMQCTNYNKTCDCK